MSTARGSTRTSGRRRRPEGARPLLVHLTTVDLSLAYLLLPQLIGFRDAGYDVVGVSAPGPHVALTRYTRAADVRADLATDRDFARICRELRPDIVHTHNPKPGV